jgi:hypothetical protein
MAAEAGGRTDDAGTGEPLVILAAGGRLPIQVATAARKAGRDVLIIGLEGEADEGITAFPHATAKWGQVGRVEDLIRATARAGGRHGSSAIAGFRHGRRPALRCLPRLSKACSARDTILAFASSLRSAATGSSARGGATVAEAGTIAGRCRLTTLADARLALDAARAIGAIDAGQAASRSARASSRLKPRKAPTLCWSNGHCGQAGSNGRAAGTCRQR